MIAQPMTTQILIRLPEAIADRLKAAVPARQRNRFVAQLIEVALIERERALGAIADAVTAEERDSTALRGELTAWERSTLTDGLEPSL